MEGPSVRVLEATATGAALVAAALRLGLVPALLDDVGRVAMRAADALGPAEGPNDLVTLGVIDDGQDVDDHACRAPGLLGEERLVASPDVIVVPGSGPCTHPPETSDERGAITERRGSRHSRATPAAAREG